MVQHKQAPKLIFFNLPEKDSIAYISVIFSYGNYSESSRDFGLGHLLEHYLSLRIENFSTSLLRVASIGDSVMQFDIKSKKKNIIDHLAGTLGILKNDPIDSKVLMNREKARIKIELDEYSTNTEKYFEQQSLLALLGGSSVITRDKVLQNNTIKKVQLSDLVKLRNRLISRHLVGICIGAYKLSKKSRIEIQSNFRRWLPTEARLFFAPTPHIKIALNKKRIVSHASIGKGYSHVSFAWPGLSLRDPLRDRFALGFVCSLLLERLESPLGDIGVYKFDYDYQIYDNHGIVRFWAYMPRGLEKKFEKIIYNQLEILLSQEKELKEGIKEFITKRTKRLKNEWRVNTGRVVWVVDDIVDLGKVIPLAGVIQELKKVNLISVSRVAKKNLNNKRQRILIVRPTKT